MCVVCGCGKQCNCIGCSALAEKFKSEPVSDKPAAENQ